MKVELPKQEKEMTKPLFTKGDTALQHFAVKGDGPHGQVGWKTEGRGLVAINNDSKGKLKMLAAFAGVSMGDYVSRLIEAEYEKETVHEEG